MKKFSFFLLFGLTCLALPLRAATGSANDGLYLVVFVVALLLLLAGIGSFIDILRHPPQALRTLPKRIYRVIRSWFAFIRTLRNNVEQGFHPALSLNHKRS